MKKPIQFCPHCGLHWRARYLWARRDFAVTRELLLDAGIDRVSNEIGKAIAETISKEIETP